MSTTFSRKALDKECTVNQVVFFFYIIQRNKAWYRVVASDGVKVGLGNFGHWNQLKTVSSGIGDLHVLTQAALLYWC